MDIGNLWKETGNKETDDLNRIKTWLCGSTDGQTYSIPFNVDVDAISEKGYEYEYPEQAFDSVVGWKHDYKVDDPDLENTATEIYNGLKALEEDLVNHPETYFPEKKTSKSVCQAHKGIFCDYCVGTLNECTYDANCPFSKISQ